MNKDAKRLRDNFGCSYQTALRLIQEKGLDEAIEILSATRGAEDQKPSEPAK